MMNVVFRLWWWGFLVVRASALPDVKPGLAATMVEAATAAETPRVGADLVLGIAWPESRFEIGAMPRCGVMQVWPADLDLPARECARWRSSQRDGAAAGVLEIETMLSDRRVAGDVRVALMYRACGGSAFTGRCQKARWVSDAMERARQLRAGFPMLTGAP